jgi:two-component system NarL family sensor kinase
MPERAASRLAWSLCALTAVLALPHVFVVYLNREALGAGADIILSTAASVMSVGYAAVGALIASRARNIIGWLFVAVGVGLSIGGFAEDYVVQSLSAHGGRLPATTLLAWLASWAWLAAVLPISLLLLLFPTGRVPTRRWRILPRALLIATGAALVANMFKPGKAFNHPVGEVRNPVGITALGPLTEAVLFPAVLVILGGLLASIVALFLRYRRAKGEERLQMK